MIGKEKAKKCALIMHTAVVDQNGTDLRAVKEALCDPDYVNVYFSSDRLTPEQMNLLYNVADVNVLMSSNEGFSTPSYRIRICLIASSIILNDANPSISNLIKPIGSRCLTF